MKILILLSRFPQPLEKGDKLRAFYQIKELSENNEIILCCFTHSRVKSKYIKQLEPYCKEVKIIKLRWFYTFINLVKAFSNGLPFQVACFYQKQAQKQFDKLLVKHMPRHIYCQLVRVAEYTLKYTIFPKTIDYMDALSKGVERRVDKSPSFMKALLRSEAARLKKYESGIFDSFTVKTIISEQDRDLIENPRRGEIKIIRNGVNTTYFAPQNIKKEYDLVFTGNMSYPPNVDSVRYLVNEILPVVWKINPKIKLLISGTNPTARVKALASKNVKVTGWIDDIRKSYSIAKIFIAPMRIGTGLQNKLLEAMAMKIPCITTSLANNALGAEENHSILVGNDANELAAQILCLLNDEEQRTIIGENGYKFVHQNYNWENFCSELNVLIQNARINK